MNEVPFRVPPWKTDLKLRPPQVLRFLHGGEHEYYVSDTRVTSEPVQRFMPKRRLGIGQDLTLDSRSFLNPNH